MGTMSDTEDAAAITPLDTLEDTIGSQVTVRTKAGQLIKGTLAGYDEHMNLTLAGSTATDDTDTDEDPRLVRGSRVVAITHSPSEGETAVDAEPNTDAESKTDHDQTTRPTDTAASEPVPRLIELKDQLDPKNLTVDIDAEGETLIVTKLGQEYRIQPDGTVEGDGPHREQLEQFLAD